MFSQQKEKGGFYFMKDNSPQKFDKKIAILEATLELIAEHGFHNTPTSKIAKKAQVGVGSIYRYFQDKDALIHGLFTYVSEREHREILEGHDFEAPVREQFIRICRRIVRFAIRFPREMWFIEQYLHSPYGLLKRRDLVRDGGQAECKRPPLIELFEAARAQQIVKDLPPYVLGTLTFGPLMMLLRDIQSGLIEHDDDMVQYVIEACWDAVKR